MTTPGNYSGANGLLLMFGAVLVAAIVVMVGLALGVDELVHSFRGG